MTSEKPGRFPFTRGIHKDMYRQRLWTMRQYSGFTSAEESNKRYKYLLENGVTGLSVAFDLPTQIGYDSDHPMSKGEVGKVGVPISTLENMESLLDGIPLDKVSTSMTINSTAAILLAFYIAVAEKQELSLKQLKGTIQNDILKEYIARGTYIYPPGPSLRIITDIFEFCDSHIPQWNTISISGYHIREAGSSAVQELAFTFANGIAYVQAAVDKGLNPNKFGRRLSFFFNAHNGFLTEIAKFRAARQIWATIMKDRFDVTDEKAVRESFKHLTKEFGGLDILISNAGNAIRGRIGEVDSATLRGSFELNFFAHQTLASQAVQLFQKQKTGGVLLFNASKAAFNPGKDFGPYALPKATVVALMKQYALDYGKERIRSNAINADRVRTNLFTKKVLTERSVARGLSPDEYFKSNLLETEVFDTDVAKGFFDTALAEKTTGSVITIDGGNIAASPR